jgi:dTDP-L-rhamnose 4-epimerase
VLITGGAGFIGSHVARHLLEQGDRVRVLDSLISQVHGDGGRPAYLDDDVELIHGDVADARTLQHALVGVDAVIHLAARVGVGQSMYEITDYTEANALGTATLLQALMQRPVRKLLVASSMSVYGEGLYRTADGRLAESITRSRGQLERGEFEPSAPGTGEPLTPLPTPEWKQPSLTSIYALGKYDQERMCLMFGSAYAIPTVALRFFNVYGPDQALSNPYTGVLAIFASRLLNGRPPLIFEDGEQRRDFVSVHDVARACGLALARGGADGLAVNIGSGHSITVNEIASRLAAVLDRTDVEPEITGKYRVGDIRHCFADVALARRALGYAPRTSLSDGIEELAEWLEGQVADDRVDTATRELAARGLTL